MYTVLLPVDASEERAAAQADTAANLPDASESVTVHLLHVFDDHEEAHDASVSQTEAGDVAAKRLRGAGVTTNERSTSGDPAAEILQAAEDVNADMILLGGRKRSPLGSVLFGSVSQEVTLDAERPVVVTGGRENTEPPTHRCQSCGEEYYTDPTSDITSCRNCGGTKVERVGEVAEPGPAA